MIQIETFASGSSGNCHLLNCGGMKILLDCGIRFKRLIKLMKGTLPTLVLITHEHGDHANIRTIKKLIQCGVDIVMSAGTARALKLEGAGLIFRRKGDYGTIHYEMIDVKHDAAEPVNFLVTDGDDTLVYLTDLGEIPQSKQFNFAGRGINKVMIEMNYDQQRLMTADIPDAQKSRITENHLSVTQAQAFLMRFRNLNEVHICHMSKRHGAETWFRMLAALAVPDAKVILATEI